MAMFALVACGCAQTANDPVRSSVAPGLIVVERDGGTSGGNARRSESGSLTSVARGTGTPSDQALVRGDTAYLRDNWDEAARAYGDAARLAPLDPAPIVGLVRVDLGRHGAPTSHAAGKNNPVVLRSVERLRHALSLDEGYGLASLELGRALLVLDESDEALSVLARSVRLLPNSPEAHSAYGVALIVTGSVSAALVPFRRAVELDPDNADRKANLATALLMQGLVLEAISILEVAVGDAPRDGRILTSLGTAYLAANDSASAMPYLQRAVDVAPNRATFRSNLGYGMHLFGDNAGAIAQYRKAIELDPELVSAWVNLGVVYAKTGRRTEAREAFERAVSLDPTDPRPKANLRDLDETEGTRPSH